MHGMHCRETETGSPQCTGSPPSRKIEKFGLGWFNSPLALRASSLDLDDPGEIAAANSVFLRWSSGMANEEENETETGLFHEGD